MTTSDGEMISLCPKSYIVHCRKTSETKDGRKGIPNYVKLTARDFFDTLYEKRGSDNRVEVRSLRLNNERKMGRTTTMKAGLSNVHVKLQVQMDKISCAPLRNADGSFV